MSVRRNILFNGIANVLSKTVRVADQLLLVPFFLSEWGAAYYGEWLTLSIIPSVLAFSDLGFGSAAASSFVLAYSSGDKQRAYDIFHVAVRVISCSILLGVALSIGAIVVVDQSGGLAKSLIPAQDCIYALAFIMLARLLSFYSQLFEALYRAKRRAATSTNIGTIGGFLRIVIGIAVLYSGCGVVGFTIAQLCATVVCESANLLIGLRIFHDPIQGRWSKAYAVDIIKKGLGFMFTPIWQSIYFQGTTFAVRIALGAEAVAIFNTIRTVCRSVNQMFSIVNGSIFPELQSEYGAGNLPLVRQIFSRAVRIVALLAVVGVAVLSVVGLDIYAWWTHNTLMVPVSMWYIFMSGILFNALWWTAGAIFRVINQPYKFAAYGMISASVSAVATYVLSTSMGLTGAAIGYVAMDVMMSILVLPYACKCIQMNVSDLFGRRS
jgi:O-antigen/teichoic acid export membrane protein